MNKRSASPSTLNPQEQPEKKPKPHRDWEEGDPEAGVEPLDAVDNAAASLQQIEFVKSYSPAGFESQCDLDLIVPELRKGIRCHRLILLHHGSTFLQEILSEFAAVGSKGSRELPAGFDPKDSHELIGVFDFIFGVKPEVDPKDALRFAHLTNALGLAKLSEQARYIVYKFCKLSAIQLFDIGRMCKDNKFLDDAADAFRKEYRGREQDIPKHVREPLALFWCRRTAHESVAVRAIHGVTNFFMSYKRPLGAPLLPYELLDHYDSTSSDYAADAFRALQNMWRDISEARLVRACRFDPRLTQIQAHIDRIEVDAE